MQNDSACRRETKVMANEKCRGRRIPGATEAVAGGAAMEAGVAEGGEAGGVH